MPDNCDNCGVCCMGQNLLPWAQNKVDQCALPPELQQALDAVIEGPLGGDDNCPCIWLDRATGRCLHYEHRPSFCIEFKRSGESCLKQRREARLEG